MTLAVCPGSFDPVTLGHLDVIRRARAMFDEVVVVVGHNAAKHPLLSVDERVMLVQTAVVGLEGVMVTSWDGLLADFLVRSGACAVVKGLRGGADVDAELGMALLNRHLSGVDTVFVPGDGALAHVASSLVKDVARHGGAIDDLVPIGVAAAVRAAVVREASAAREAAAVREAAAARQLAP
ncbi:MAG: pantetheine-phosphate adenylyltransferase [Micrococcales bacterium]|nr:pantetheine-phosphate adenylyltransferase [Micrococcales bacterium]